MKYIDITEMNVKMNVFLGSMHSNIAIFVSKYIYEIFFKNIRMLQIYQVSFYKTYTHIFKLHTRTKQNKFARLAWSPFLGLHLYQF